MDKEPKRDDNHTLKSINDNKQKVINKLISLNVEMKNDIAYMDESDANAQKSQSTLQN